MYGSAVKPDPAVDPVSDIRSVVDLENAIKARQVETGKSAFRLIIRTPVSLVRCTVRLVAGCWMEIDGEVDRDRLDRMQKLLCSGGAWLEGV
jgi:hypothetical protein